MAETAGLILGIVTLAGAFKDCVDLFAYISASKSMGKDHEILNTKLDIEKTLLLQWASRVGLYQPDHYDPRLDDPTVQRVVFKTLSCILHLLSSSVELERDYGLEQTDFHAAVGPRMSESRWQRLELEYERFQSRTRSKQKAASVTQRFYWAVKDREKFNTLVRDLSYFVTKLEDIVPPGETEDSVAIMMNADLAAVQSMRGQKGVKTVLEAAKHLHVGFAALAQRHIDTRCQERIIERLWYRSIDDRRNDVANAHAKTFQWALECGSQKDQKWDDLPQWLLSGSDCYWISGKPGSGKSTFMKYLYQHPDTRELLEQWASTQDRTLLMASFFFWHLGTPEQKTQQGLSRGLLYHILNADPSLIPHLLPSMWREAHATLDNQDLGLPSSSEVAQAFSKLRTISTRDAMCFFIDGLDEYSGHIAEGIQFIRGLISGNSIKVLVSSRPTAPCFQAFAQKPKLRLQDLTVNDIKTYVDDTVGAHGYTLDLMSIDAAAISGILDTLVSKASGVFLWVVLACQSLLEGYDAFDYPKELQRRVNELPSELEDLFKHILRRIEPRYQVQATEVLKICYQRQVSLEAQTRSDDIPAFGGVPSLGMALHDDHRTGFNRSSSFQKLSVSERERMCRVLESRLRSRCCGLVEIHRRRRCFCEQCDIKFFSEDTARPDFELLDSRVEFMHRTVFDFLSCEGIWDIDCLQTSHQPSGFEPQAALSRIYLHLMYIHLDDDCPTHIDQLARDSLLYAHAADREFRGQGTPSGYHFARVAYDIIRSSQTGETELVPAHSRFFSYLRRRFDASRSNVSTLALLLAVELGMINMVRHWEALGVFQHVNRSLVLFHAIERSFCAQLPYLVVSWSPEMIALLLARGCDPNATMIDPTGQPVTPWMAWLRGLKRGRIQGPGRVVTTVTKMFIQAGADTDAFEEAIFADGEPRPDVEMGR
ncbi:hypothetical protein F4778DRAFT_545284 [Xylariomycetidae sp. FL2044]|nr:hypothetical protein F4778DRAFT_545284 [Xylariomycetidae sp. FL2044]